MKTYQLDLTKKQLKSLETLIITYGDDILQDTATNWTRSEKKALSEVFRLVTATRVLGDREIGRSPAIQNGDAHGENHIVPLVTKENKKL